MTLNEDIARLIDQYGFNGVVDEISNVAHAFYLATRQRESRQWLQTAKQLRIISKRHHMIPSVEAGT